MRDSARDFANDQDDEIASALLSYSKEEGRDLLAEAERRAFLENKKKGKRNKKGRDIVSSSEDADADATVKSVVRVSQKKGSKQAKAKLPVATKIVFSPAFSCLHCTCACTLPPRLLYPSHALQIKIEAPITQHTEWRPKSPPS